MARLNRRALAAAAAALIAASGCSSSHSPRGTPPARQGAPPPSAAPVTELSYAVNSSPPANWNILAAGTDQQALSAVADQVWPSVFTFGPDFNPVLNTALVQSATETSQYPQTIVYKINPEARWSDGTPVSGADFVYNWSVQSGSAATTDVNGKAFTPASISGYSDVKSVTISPASSDVVTVVFSTPDPDWTALFRHLLPAHVAQRVGFDTGFTDPIADLVSDGPYVVASYDPSGVVHLVRNPSYAGPPAAALELDVHFLPDTEQITSALTAGQISCASVPATAAALSTLKSAGNLTVNVAPGSTYIDVVFNAKSGPMRSADTRAAVTQAIARSGVISQALAGVDPQAPPTANRFLVTGESGYTANTTPPLPGGKAPPTSVAGLRFEVTLTDAVAVAASQAVAEQLDAAGFQVETTTSGTWDIALIERQLTPWPSQVITAYSSGSPANLGGVSSAALDQAVAAAAAASGSQRPVLIDQVDEAAWQAYADLPIVAIPQVLACQSNVSGAAPNPSPDGPAFNAARWGLTSGSP
ncbi:MAG TPA: ABC transporter substrate-binding protein [Acidimicrobiales bacterium]|nr:ABC transporter substrate-binding protein [Acidimicrobiales bacterium]